MSRNDIHTILHSFSIPLMAEGVAMLLCLIPSLHFHDGTWRSIVISGVITICVGLLCLITFHSDPHQKSDRRASYIIVVLMWFILVLFATLPFLATGTLTSFTQACFESMSGLTTTGATMFNSIVTLPASILFWRSIMEWVGGFGIVLMVLAVVPKMGINKFSLYTAEASGADNSQKAATTIGSTIRRTLTVYISLTIVFIIMLTISGMEVWDAVNMTFTNISSGGFSIYDEGLAPLTHTQQYMLAAAMFVSAINFTMLYNFFTFGFNKLRSKWDQLVFHTMLTLLSSGIVILMLRLKMGLPWDDSFRMGLVQTVSVVSTTGSVVADTRQWWSPILFLFIPLMLCGGMAGSTAGGLKAMRIVILTRNVRNIIRNRLHPNVVNPMRLNGRTVYPGIVNNVMVIFMAYIVTLFASSFLMILFNVNCTEAIGASAACLTGYGPGLGTCGGYGSYSHFSNPAKWVCIITMLLGRLECLTVFVIFLPGFWKRH